MLIDNSNVDNFIAKLESQIFENRKKVAFLKRMKNKYLSIRITWDRSDRDFFTTPEVNGIVDQIEIFHSCSCCPDPAVLFRAYREEEGFRIYGNPFKMVVGERFNCSDSPDSDWKERVLKEGYSNVVIEKIEKHFEEEEKERESYGEHDDESDFD